MSTHNTRSNNNNIDKSKSIKSNTNTDRDDGEGRHESLEERGRVVSVGEEKIVVLDGRRREKKASSTRDESHQSS